MEQEKNSTQIIFNFGPVNGDVMKQEIHLRELEGLAPNSSLKEREQDVKIVPDELLTPVAEELLNKFKNAGLLDGCLQPIDLSGANRGVLAAFLSHRLGLKNTWQMFGELWGEKPETLRRAYNRGMEQKKTLAFQDRLKEIAEGDNYNE